MVKNITKLTRVIAKLLNVSEDDLLANFRPATAADFDAITTLRNKNLRNIYWDDAAYFRWRYAFDENEPEIKAGNNVWVLHVHGQLLAMVGVLRFSVCVKGDTCSAVHPLDILVDKKYEGMGVGAWMQLIIRDQADVMLVIGANQNSQSMVKRMFHAMPSREVWKLPIDSAIYFSKLSLVAPLSRIFTWVGNTCLGLSLAVKSLGCQRLNIQLRTIDRFDESVSALSFGWTHVAYFRPRSAAFLNWRFFDCPECEFRAMGFYKEDQLRGYIVYHTAADKGNRLRVLVDDFFWAEPEKHSSQNDFCAFFVLFAQEQKRRGAAIIEVTSYGMLARTVLLKTGFIQRPSDNLLFSIAHNGISSKWDIVNSEQWFITEADAHGAGV